MPFFLVTQTSLVEAQDEQEAAQTGVDRFRSGGQVIVSVRSDETTITHVTVAPVTEESLSLAEIGNPSPPTIPLPEIATATPESRKLILKRMLADGLALLGRRT
ncbi:hypothetical protein AGR1_25485 [Agrobacterium sp. B1(2019)]|nr:hypothetical protein AGR1_25485 [Agrobacterium sp. B1(2019)]